MKNLDMHPQKAADLIRAHEIALLRIRADPENYGLAEEKLRETADHLFRYLVGKRPTPPELDECLL